MKRTNSNEAYEIIEKHIKHFFVSEEELENQLKQCNSKKLGIKNAARTLVLKLGFAKYTWQVEHLVKKLKTNKIKIGKNHLKDEETLWEWYKDIISLNVEKYFNKDEKEPSKPAHSEEKKENEISEKKSKEIKKAKEYVAQKNKKVRDIQEEIAEGIKNAYNSVNPEDYKEYLDTMAKFHQYSRNNMFMIRFQNPEATMVNSFKGWKDVGRYVKKGEKGLMIFVPAPYSYVRINGKTIPRKKYTKKIKKDIKEGTLKENKSMSFRIGYVFDISQTDGEPLPSMPHDLMENSEKLNDIKEKIIELLKEKEYTVTYKEMGFIKGSCSPKNKSISLNKNNSDQQNIKTLIHEYAHGVMHRISKKPKNQKEVEAESVAYIVSKYFGVDTSDYSFDYLASWSSGKELKELEKSSDTIEKHSKKIIDQLEEKLYYYVNKEENPLLEKLRIAIRENKNVNEVLKELYNSKELSKKEKSKLKRKLSYIKKKPTIDTFKRNSQAINYILKG